MNVILQDEIIKKFHNLFTTNLGTLNDVYISVLDGWSLIIIECLKEINTYLSNSNDNILVNDFYILDIKESYGKLVIYTSVLNEDIENIILKYTEKSLITCELTGLPGKIRYKNGFYKTLSDDAAKKMKFNI